MTKWIVGLVVVIIVVGAGYYFRHAIKGIFVKQPSQEVAQEPTDPTATWASYASSTMGVSIKYPPTYTLNPAYAYTGVSAKKPIAGISVTIPASMATGTNLGSDTYLSVEQLPHAKACTGDIFVAANVKATDMLDNGITYSMATTSGAGAGNRYDETVYAIKDSKPCTAVRYFVHYSAIENYPAGAVTQFDQAALVSAFDQIRRTVTLTGSVTPDVTPVASTTTQ